MSAGQEGKNTSTAQGLWNKHQRSSPQGIFAYSSWTWPESPPDPWQPSRALAGFWISIFLKSARFQPAFVAAQAGQEEQAAPMPAAWADELPWEVQQGSSDQQRMKTTGSRARGNPRPRVPGCPPGWGSLLHCWPRRNSAAVRDAGATAALKLDEKQLLPVGWPLVPL